MYTTCQFCRRRLGRNTVLENFPTGRRIAFDPANGRLWAVCTACDRWNLSPIEERFEVLEDCEKRFREARRRVSTDNIGLARVSPDLDLVRIGRALRPEFAAWRYGRKLRARHAQMTTLIATSMIVAGGIGVAGLSQRVFGFDTLYLGAYSYIAAAIASHRWRRLARVDTGTGTFVDVRGQDLRRIILRDCAGEPALELSHAGGVFSLRGPVAIVAARAILPWTNRSGGSTRQLAAAVEMLESRGDAATWPGQLADGAAITSIPSAHRLAVEMASNEDVERRALDGELSLIERAWRDAEEVASIADNLLVPPFVEQWLSRSR